VIVVDARRQCATLARAAGKSNEAAALIDEYRHHWENNLDELEGLPERKAAHGNRPLRYVRANHSAVTGSLGNPEERSSAKKKPALKHQ